MFNIKNNNLVSCDKLASGIITIPDDVISINSSAFENCHLVTKIILPETVKEFGYSSIFKNCTSLVEINIPPHIKKIPSNCFENCVNLKKVTLHNDITEIGMDAFKSCRNLKNISLPTSLKKISYDAFADCSSLTKIFFPDTINSIYQRAFANCISLIEVVIPNGIHDLYSETFLNCKSLTSVRLLADSIRISPTAFKGCYNIQQLYMKKFNPILAISSFGDCEHLNFINPIQDEQDSKYIQPISSEQIHKEQAELLKYHSLYYRLFNMNITQMKWSESLKNEKSFKEPIDTGWALYKHEAQPLEYLLSMNWNNSAGIGLVLGFNKYRAIDVDDVDMFNLLCTYGDEETGLNILINKFLSILGLPDNYPWVVKSGSGKGFHIIFKCDDIDEKIDSISFEPNDNYNDGHGSYEFLRIELRWSDHLILPPSIHASGNRYSFRNNVLPSSAPDSILLSSVDKLITKYCGNRRFVSYSYNNQSFLLTNIAKIHSRHDSYLTPHEHNEDSIAWLNEVHDNESLNSLAIRYVLAKDVGFDKQKAFHLLEQSNTQSSFFNLASLYACGFFPCDYYSFQSILNRLDKKLFSNFMDEIEKNAKNNITPSNLYLFFDTETTGIPRDYNAPSSRIDNWPRLVQLSWLLVSESGKTYSTGDYIIKPNGFFIPYESTQLHGISNAIANEKGVEISIAINKFLEDASKSVLLIGHNISFDKKIVGAELIRLGKSDTIANKESFCTMKSTVDYCQIPDKNGFGYKFPKLQELYQKLFGKSLNNAHNSLDDVKATKDCFFELLKRNIIMIPKTNHLVDNNDLPF